MIQQAALALISGMWNMEVLIAVATIDMWYIGHVDISEDVHSDVVICKLVLVSCCLLILAKEAKASSSMHA